MKRANMLLILGCVLMTFGYTKGTHDNEVSKIYLIDNTLIRTVKGEGIRFYDISNPASATEVGYLPLKEATDVAVSGTTMYADREYDLMVYDISDPGSPKAIDSVLKTFNYLNDNFNEWEGDWVEGDDFSGMSGCNGMACADEEPVSAPRTVADAANGEAGGQGGSLARFMIVGNYLYCIDQVALKVFDISDPEHPRYRNSVDIAWQIETIFHDGEHLFIGGRNGMYIYDLMNPEQPHYISEFTHAASCDPVVVDGNRAYVTLRGGSPCGGFSNQLDIIDISTISNPRLLKSVPMDGPYGLAARDGIVLVCDGSSGMKSMNTSDLQNITKCGGIEGVTAHDVIWYGNLLILTAEDGFYTYDISDPCNPKKFGRLDF